MSKKSAWDMNPDDLDSIDRQFAKDASKKVLQDKPTETGIVGRQRKAYTESDARDPFRLNGHEILGFSPLDYMQKNTTPTSVVLSPFSKLSTYVRSKLDPNSPSMTQLASREVDEYLSIVGLTFMVEQFGYEKVLERYSVDEIERVLVSLNGLQKRINNSQMALQGLLLSNAKNNR
ncbi:hypothetical protein [Photobacterium damselae]|uniref:hypothetical protein n=1 Tax=Photobacterium damselae TaxID=38293 RepID=UPI0040681ADA